MNKLRVAGVLTAPIDEYFETIFETGVDEMSWDDLSKNDMAWPAVAEVTVYRRKARRRHTRTRACSLPYACAARRCMRSSGTS